MQDEDTVVIPEEEEIIEEGTGTLFPDGDAPAPRKGLSSAEKLTLVSPDEPSRIMEKFGEQLPKLPEVGDLVEGPVIGIEKSAIYIDIPPFGTGTIYGREFMSARDIIKKINIGDSVTAKIVQKEN